jgi:hypothetical protein
MEQKDFLLREIAKIGQIIRAIRQKLFGGNDQLAISLEQQVDDAKAMLLSELDFDLDEFCLLDSEATNQYLKSTEGFNIENIEGLADLLSQIGFSQQSETSKKYLEKSLQLYEYCNLQSKTYSMERERNITRISNAI